MVDDDDCSECSICSTDSSVSINWVGNIMHDFDVVFTDRKTKQIRKELGWCCKNGVIIFNIVDLTNHDNDHPSFTSSPLSQSSVERIKVTQPTSTQSVLYE